MKKNNKNFRKCIVTKISKDRSELIRIIRNKSGKIFINSDEQGRGVYVSKDVANPEIIFKQKLLNKSFRANIDKETYQELIEFIKGE